MSSGNVCDAEGVRQGKKENGEPARLHHVQLRLLLLGTGEGRHPWDLKSCFAELHSLFLEAYWWGMGGWVL